MFFKLLSFSYAASLMASVLGVLISNNWMMCWLLMEINLMMFIPLISSKEYLMESPQSIKYFLVQVLGSIILMWFILLESYKSSLMTVMLDKSFMLSISLSVKSGIPPFHFWFPQVMELCNFYQCYFLMTMQKFIPLMLLFFCTSSIIVGMIVLSGLVGAWGGFNQNSTKKIMAFSSIAHSGWILLSMKASFMIFSVYMLSYCLITLSVVGSLLVSNAQRVSDLLSLSPYLSLSLNLSLSMLSLGGLPPFLGFLGKFLVVSMTSNISFIILILMASSLTALTYYIRLMMVSMTKSNNFKKQKIIKPRSLMSKMSLLNMLLNVLMPIIIIPLML